MTVLQPNPDRSLIKSDMTPSGSLRSFATVILILAWTISIHARQYYFTHYDITNGLSQNTVHKIIQDRQGFMWFGTKDGLNRFDGRKFSRVDLSSGDRDCSFISTLFEDSRGRIWVGSHLGPCVYDPTTERLEFLEARSGRIKVLHSTINDFAEDADGNILISVDNDGVYTYDVSTGEIRRKLSLADTGISSVTRIKVLPSGRIYLGTFGSGLFYTDDGFASIRSVDSADGRPYFDRAVVNAVCIRGDKAYIATDNMGFHAIDLLSGKVSPVFVRDDAGNIPFMRDAFFTSGSEIFIASESGLYIYNLAERKLERHLKHDYYDPFSISDDAVYSVFADRDGGLWVGSYFGGIDYLGVYQPEFIRYFKTMSPGSLPSERVRELHSDVSGLIYVGSEDNGLSVFNPGTGMFGRVDGIHEKNIHGLCSDGDDLWVGTFSEGLIIKNLKNGKIRHIRAGGAQDLTSDYVFTIRRTLHGDIYVGTLSGLQRYDRSADRFVTIPALDDLFIYNIFEDSRGNLWVATYANGLFLKLAGQPEWTNYREDMPATGSIPSDKVYSVQEDSRHNIWVMTQNGACVYSPKDKEFSRAFHGIDKIPGVAYRMEEDAGGKYWISSNHGLYCIDPGVDKMWNFTTHDGLPTNQFNYNSSMKSVDGNLYFGSIKGLVCFEPLRFAPTAVPEEKPIVSELYVNAALMKPGAENSPLTKSISMTDELTLRPWQNSVAMRLTGLDYGNSGRQRIKYRLEGYDDDWSMLQPGNSMVVYSNLPSGDYRLQAALCSDDGSDSGPMLDMPMTVETPLLRTWWALTLYLVVGVSLLTFLYIYYRRYTRLSNERYIENFKYETERELFDSKIKFFTNVAHEIRTPLTLIKATLDSVKKSNNVVQHREMKDNINVIDMNVDRLLNLADELLDFRKIESGDYIVRKQRCNVSELVEHLIVLFRPTIDASEKKFELLLPENDVVAYVDAGAVTKIVSNLLSNAIKYSSGYIKVELTSDADAFVLTVSNDGSVVRGEEREHIFRMFARLDTEIPGTEIPGTGIGLAFSRSLAEMHDGSLVMDESDSENIFVLRIPLGEPSDEEDKEVLQTDLEQIVRVSGDNSAVLLVDDNVEITDLLRRKLEECNYRVFTATDVDEALKILEGHRIDIVVTDIKLSRSNGYGLVKCIKEDPALSHIPVIILTANTRIEDKITGLEAGADSYIEKPFSVDYLLISIQSMLRNRERMRAVNDTDQIGRHATKDLSKDDEEFLVEVDGIIRSHYDNPEFSVDDMIEMLGISNSTFYRKIKRLLNLNPNEYIKIQRLKRAVELFRDGYTSVSEVGYMVGFSSPGYFTKCFQKHYGVSPKEYISDLKK